jgi:hypothetical protein
VYVADGGNARIRKITPSGIISTIAGNGTVGYSGDGGPATSAALTVPWGLTVDSAGDIFIADWHNHRIRKITTAGIISSIAGTGTAGFNGDGIAATAARLSFPTGVAVDKHGNVYIADNYNDRIRKIDHSGTISTVTGDLYWPYSVWVDAAGNLYITDTWNVRIRKLTASGAISTIGGNGYGAGAGTGGYSGCKPITAHMLCFPEPLVRPHGHKAHTDRANGEAQITISNTLGEKVKEWVLPANAEMEVTLRLPAGIYYLTTVTANQKQASKIVIE